MAEIEIEKNVPMVKRRGREKKYPLDSMQPGDSFFIPNIKVAPMGSIAKIRSLHPDQKFVTRKEGDGIRVWRTV